MKCPLSSFLMNQRARANKKIRHFFAAAAEDDDDEIHTS